MSRENDKFWFFRLVEAMGGIKGNPFVVAINKNPKAPIFQVADVGIVTDMLDFIPELTEKIEEINE